MCVTMSEFVRDGEGVETGILEGKETEGEENIGKNRNRQIEGRRASEAGRADGSMSL